MVRDLLSRLTALHSRFLDHIVPTCLRLPVMLRRLLCLIGAISLIVRTGSAASCDIRLWVRADDLHA